MEVIVAERQGSDREVVAERRRRQNPDRRNTNWQRGRAWATSVLANAKSKDHPDTSGRARRRGVKVQVLTRGELRGASCGEVSRNHSSEDVPRKRGRAKGGSTNGHGSTRSYPARREASGTHGEAFVAQAVDGHDAAEPVEPGRAQAGEDESRWRSEGHPACGTMNEQLMEEAVSPENWHTAWKAVVSNAGAPGIDGMRCEQLVEHLQRHGEAIRAKLLAGRYTPSPVKRTRIPKPGGGERLLGIPTVMDRFVQQLLLQVLSPIYERHFSARSYGFRPGRSTHDAVRQAQAYVKEGKGYVVDLDIEKFFDRVNHDVLMHRLREKVSDVRVRKLIGRYLKAGVMVNGVVQDNEEEGTPQGGPLSPLLGNIYLDPLDKELESRGLAYVRYADDCNIYVSSETAAQRVLTSLIGWIEKKLRLKVNQTKSGAGPTTGRRLLGFSVNAQGVIAIAQKNVNLFKEKVRAIWDARRQRSNEEKRKEWNQYVRGWCNHFALAQEVRWAKGIDGWIRRHIRKYYWQRWHNARGRFNALKRLGVKGHHWASARSSRGAWRMAASFAMQAALSSGTLRRYGYLMPSALLAR